MVEKKDLVAGKPEVEEGLSTSAKAMKVEASEGLHERFKDPHALEKAADALMIAYISWSSFRS